MMVTMADALPAEPDDRNAVRDCEGDVWVRIGNHWFAPGRVRPWAWSHLVMTYGPLHLLVDGPAITQLVGGTERVKEDRCG